jgi:hypothetical protein
LNTGPSSALRVHHISAFLFRNAPHGGVLRSRITAKCPRVSGFESTKVLRPRGSFTPVGQASSKTVVERACRYEGSATLFFAGRLNWSIDIINWRDSWDAHELIAEILRSGMSEPYHHAHCSVHQWCIYLMAQP